MRPHEHRQRHVEDPLLSTRRQMAKPISLRPSTVAGPRFHEGAEGRQASAGGGERREPL